MDYHSLTEQVKEYSMAFFGAPENQFLPYHNLNHTEGVVQAAILTGNHYQLDDRDFYIVVCAAWFHDMGYFTKGPTGHEQQGAEIAARFLAERGVDNDTVNKVQSCILATKMPQTPVSLLEQIVCDADLFHFGTDEFPERNKLMRKEFELLNQTISKEEWRQSSIKLLQSHHYHTDFCKMRLNNKKQENLNKLLKKQEQVSEKSLLTPASEKEETNSGKKGKQKKKDTDRPERGIETMFRVASTNHQRLSDMSDNKAHIMISVNSIIISLLIALVMRRLEASADINIIVPTGILLSGCMIAVIFAVLATRPKIPDGHFSQEQVDKKSANLLFFGNFYRMGYDEYYDGMQKVMADSEYLYKSLIIDLHSQGKVLGRKFKLIRISYTIFMFTLITSVIAFAITSIFFA